MSKFPHHFQQSCNKMSKMNNEATYIVSLDLECHRQPELLVCSPAVFVGSSREHWAPAGFAAVCQDITMVSRSDQTMGGNQPFPNHHTTGMMIITARKRSLRRLCFYRCLSVHRRGGIPGCIAGHMTRQYISRCTVGVEAAYR